tara:strand:+ start:103 stop:852 length:750 start_codon:yes stop_codon:yes gene_type:complete
MKSNNYWTFEILPSGNFLNSFSRISGNFSIGEDHSAIPLNFLLNSSHFTGKEEPKEVYSIATFIIAMINGYTKLINIDSNEHSLVWLGNLYNNGKKVREDYKCEVDLLKIYDFIESKIDSDEFINQGFNDEFIRNILLYCNSGWNLGNMYKISDEISDFLKERNDDISNYVKKTEYRAFGATANNFSVSGLEARHGKIKNSAPKKIMNLEQASSFIRDLLKIILEKFFDIKLHFIIKEDTDFNLETFEF